MSESTRAISEKGPNRRPVHRVPVDPVTGKMLPAAACGTRPKQGWRTRPPLDSHGLFCPECWPDNSGPEDYFRRADQMIAGFQALYGG